MLSLRWLTLQLAGLTDLSLESSSATWSCQLTGRELFQADLLGEQLQFQELVSSHPRGLHPQPEQNQRAYAAWNVTGATRSTRRT